MREEPLVWLLEDSPLEAEMVRRAVSSRNRVEIFADGSVVLERIANGGLPDVLVLDWQLPGMSGLEICRFLRSQHDPMTLPILMLTGFGKKQDMIDALDAGANDYVTKPFDVAELKARVATLSRTSHLQKAQTSRSRELAIAAQVGASLTLARTFEDIAKAAARAITSHRMVDAVCLYELISGSQGTAASVGTAELATPAELEAAARSHTPLLLRVEGAPPESGKTQPENTPSDASKEIWAFPLFMVGAPIGVLCVRALAGSAEDVVRSLSPVAHLLALGIARLTAEGEREKAFEAERSARSEAERANHAKDEFLAMISHELRTPLNSIAGWTSMLLSGSVEPSRVTKALQTIERNAKTQAQLIEDLLDISRAMSDKLVLEKVSFDLAAAIELARESTKPSAVAHQVQVEVIVEAGLGDVSGDPRRVQQIIWNLLSNAIKFSQVGGTVVIHAARRDDEIVIEVRDQGQGIAPDFLPFVFERFRQADSSSIRNRGGLGLGLAIVRHLTELHGGSVSVESPGVGHGATFRVKLPGIASGPVSLPPAERESAEPGALTGARILVVEDDEDSLQLLVAVLERSGAIVRAAASALDGFDLLEMARPDLLISDVAMPGQDGITFVRRVRALSKEKGGAVPAIALSAFARPVDRERALDAGFQSYVTKPVQPKELIAAVRSLLGRS